MEPRLPDFAGDASLFTELLDFFLFPPGSANRAHRRRVMFDLRAATAPGTIAEFPQTRENAVFEYAEKHQTEHFDPLADHVKLLDFPKMKLSDWKIERGKITLKGWFVATLKLQQGDAEAVENRTGSITTEDRGFDFSVTLGDDFKIAKDKETQKEIIEIKLQST